MASANSVPTSALESPATVMIPTTTPSSVRETFPPEAVPEKTTFEPTRHPGSPRFAVPGEALTSVCMAAYPSGHAPSATSMLCGPKLSASISTLPRASTSYVDRQRELLAWNADWRSSGMIDELRGARFELESRTKLAAWEPERPTRGNERCEDTTR